MQQECATWPASILHDVNFVALHALVQDGGDVQFDHFDNTSGVLYLRMIGRSLRV